MLKLANYCVLAFISTSTLVSANAATFYFEGTGHWYEPVLVTNGIDWPTSYASAVSKGGYLCTITNAAENTFVASLVDISYYSGVSINNDILGPWLGAYRNAFDSQWQWVTGEPFIYTAWYSGQPDGYGGSDQKLQYYARFTTGSTWGDHPGTTLTGYSFPRGFIIEYDHPPLSITRTNNNAILSWPLSAQGWILESTPSLSSPNWTTNSAATYQTNASGFSVTITNPAGTSFFRLRSN